MDSRQETTRENNLRGPTSNGYDPRNETDTNEGEVASTQDLEDVLWGEKAKVSRMDLSDEGSWRAMSRTVSI